MMILTGLLEWFQDGPGIAITSLGVSKELLYLMLLLYLKI